MITHDQSQAPLSSTRLYVGNLPYSARGNDVEKAFLEAGFQVERLDISTDPFTGRNPSYCFVELGSADEASRAMSELNGQTMMGRAIKININTPKHGGREPTGSSRPPTKCWAGGWRPQSIPAHHSDTGNGNPYVFDRWQRDDASDHFKLPSEEHRRLYVGGLPRISGQDLVNEEMRALFENYAIEAVSKLISPHPSKQSLPGSHYYCFVDLHTPAEAQAATQALNGTPTPSGGTYRINLAKNNDRKVDHEQFSSSRNTPNNPGPRREFSSNWRAKS